MNRSNVSLISEGKHQLAWNVAHMDSLPIQDLRQTLRYTIRLAELYEMFILEKGVRYIWEADQYIEKNKGPDYPLL